MWVSFNRDLMTNWPWLDDDDDEIKIKIKIEIEIKIDREIREKNKEEKSKIKTEYIINLSPNFNNSLSLLSLRFFHDYRVDRWLWENKMKRREKKWRHKQQQ